MESIFISNKNFKPYLTEEEIALTVKRMAAEISRDFKGKNPIFVAILNGSFIFASDLLRQLDFDCELSFVKLMSYQDTHSTGIVSELIGLKENIHGRHVVILEDIVETGRTISTLLKILSAHNPAVIKIASLLVKPHLFKEDVTIDYQGFEVPDYFIVGYGLDYNGYGRNFPDIYQIV